MISIFETSVTNTSEIENLKPLLDINLKNAKWNFDLEDCDNILRIDGSDELIQLTIKLLKDNGFGCQELTE